MQLNFSPSLLRVRRIRAAHVQGVGGGRAASEARALEVLAQVGKKRGVAESNPHRAAGCHFHIDALRQTRKRTDERS